MENDTLINTDKTKFILISCRQKRMVSRMYVDSADNVLVCDYGRTNDKFHVIKANMFTLETSIAIPGYNCSDCITIRPSDKTLAMGALSELYIFKMA